MSRQPLRRATGILLLLAAMAVAGGSKGFAQESIGIGISSQMSGDLSLIGQQSKEGAQLRVDQINQAGGVLGRKLQLYFADNACDPAQGINAASSLISNSAVTAMIGTGCSSVTLAVMPLLQRSGIAQLEYLATNPKIARESGVGGNKWQFRLNIDDAIMIGVLSKYIAKNVKSVAIVAENDDYGRGAAAAFTTDLSPTAVKITNTEFVNLDMVDYRPTITRIKSDNPEGLIVVLDAPNAAPLALQCTELGFTPKVFGRGTVVTPAFQALVKNPNIWNGAVEANRWAPNPQDKDFEDAYLKAYGRPAELNAAMAYYAVDVLASAIRAAGSATRDAIPDALEHVDLHYPGLGPVKFDAHHQAHPDMFISQWQNGKVVLLTRLATK
jgi:branched-chain amino acid transport system substrate-binding protein